MGKYVRRHLSLCVLFLLVFSPRSTGQDAQRDKKHPGKLDSLVSQVADAQDLGGDDRGVKRAGELGLRTEGGRAELTLILEPLDGKPSSTIDRDELTRLGGEVTGESESFLRVKAPIRALRKIAGHAGVRLVRSPTVPKALDGLGANLSESVALTGAGTLQQGGSTGAGVKVAVVDLGFIGLTDTIAAGELRPNTVKVLLSGQFGATFVESSTSHGTGVSEHVQDMAPGAQIYCIRVRDEVDLQNAATYCVSNGIRVANHSVGWVNSSYYDGTGPISSIINNSAAGGNLLWCVSAGNDAAAHWRGAWTDTDTDRFLDLGHGVEDYLELEGGSGAPVQLFLNWNQYGNSLTDLDLYVYNRLNQLVASSTAFQSGPQKPVESVAFLYSDSAAPYRVRVYHFTGPTAGLNVTLFSFNHTLFPPVAASSLMDPTCAPGAFSVGAIDQALFALADPPLEYYSSRGPTTDGRLKPDITAPDGTTSRTYGFQNSFGTSFSSPTTAGAACLLLQRNPSLTRLQLADALRKLAIDVGPAGPDNLYGAGKLALTTNAPPTATPLSVTTSMNTPVATPLAGTDPTGDPLTFELVPGSGPFLGTLSGTAPNLTYTPNNGITGSDSFMFRVDDGISDSAPATVSITISSGNLPPNANPQTVSTLRNTPLGITLTGSDPEGNPLTYSIVTPPSHGSLSGTPPLLTYGPAADYVGPDLFTFKVNDGTVDSAPATVSITVVRPNTAPVANPQSVATNEDTPVAFTLSASDADGDPLTFAVVTNGSKGTVLLNGAVATYTPNANANGTDSFTFRANDGQADSNVATVTVTINAINDLPVAQNGAAATNEDAPVTFLLAAADADGDPLAYSVVTNGAKGTVVLNGNAATYTPFPNANGSDSFTFKVHDGQADSNVATVLLTINPINDAPVAQDGSAATNEDTPVTLTLPATDADGDPLFYSIVANGSQGTVVLIGSSAIYTPGPNYYGPDSFMFLVNDGQANSNIATIAVTIAPINDVPVAQNGSAVTIEDVPVTFTLSATDADGDPLSYSIVTNGAKGTVVLNGGTAVYTPNAGARGADSITFKVNDGQVDSNVATVLLQINPVNHVPTAQDGAAATLEDTPVIFLLSAADPDGDPLTYSIVTPPLKGTVSLSGSTATYTPFANANGADVFTFKANDGQADSNVAVVSMAISPINDAPVAADGSATTNEDTAVTFSLSANDADGDALVYTIVSGPSMGSLLLSGSSVTYTPNPNQNGFDSFTFRVNDGQTDSNLATVTISTGVVNDVPIAENQSLTTDEDAPAGIVLAAVDPDGDPLSYSIVTPPSKGTLTLSGANATYTPNPNANGADSFTFRASDGRADSNIATVAITISPVNDPPAAHPQSVTTPAATARAITLAGDDLDGDVLTYPTVTLPANGTLSGTAPNLTYTPNPGFVGTDSFTFTVHDGTVESAPATVTITVASTTLASDGFESGNFSGGTGWQGAWVTAGDVAVTSSSSPHSGTRQARLRRSTGTMKRAVAVAGQGAVRLKFWAKGVSFEASENGTVLVSTDGTTWTTVKVFTQADANGTWKFFDLPVNVAGATTLWVSFDANMSGSGDNWYIDDVAVTTN